MKFIKWFNEISIDDTALVGGKTASLGQMITQLGDRLKIPFGFAITAAAYWRFIEFNKLHDQMKIILNTGDITDFQQLKQAGLQLRRLFTTAHMPEDIQQEIYAAYNQLSDYYKQHNLDVAVRSSATAEDLPGASFAGQQESFLHIQGTQELLEACKKCFASLFTDRAIIYRTTKGFDHFKVALSIAVQKMVRSDLAAAGVGFSLDTETGFKDLIMINASYGLGEAVVQGAINPDEFHVFKTTLKKCYKPIIKKSVGQ